MTICESDECLFRGCLVSKMKNWKAILAAVLLLAVVGGGVAVLASRPPAEDGTPANPIAAILDRGDEASGAEESGGGSAVTTAPRIDTDATGEIAPPKKKSPKTSASPGATPPTVDPAWQKYLDDTRAVVTTNQADLSSMVSEITTALGSGDRATLEKSFATDEGAQAQYLTDLAEKYPQILESQPSNTVNIFSGGGTTLYFGYSQVRWTDAGIISEHTIPIVMRFANGEWVLTTLGDTAEIEFVQSVQI